MAEMKITISTPDLSEAIKALAAALSAVTVPNASLMFTVPTVADEPGQDQFPPAPVNQEPVEDPTAPVETPVTQEVAAAPAQEVMPAPTPEPVPEPQVASTKPVTLQDLCEAGAGLIEEGKMDDVINLLNKTYGVQAVNQLQADQYDKFAADLRALGAKL